MRLKRAYISIFIVLAMFVGLLPSSRVYADPDLKITKQPEGIELHAGEGMEFHVEAEGTNLKYQWKYQFPNTTKWDNFSGATTATLVRNSVPANWDGLAVICEISDGAGNKVTTEPVYLRIITGPRIIEQPEGVETYAGEGMEFHVEAEGTNLKYQWKYQFPNTTKWDNFSGATTATLVRNSVPANWDGLAVICEISDGAGNKVTTEPVYLRIITGPTIRVNSAEGVRGDEVEVTIDLLNNPGIITAFLKLNYDEGMTCTKIKTEKLFEELVVNADGSFDKESSGMTFTPSGEYEETESGIYVLKDGEDAPKPCTLYWDDIVNQTQSGTLVTLTFKISDNASVGNYRVWVSYEEGDIYQAPEEGSGEDYIDIDFDIIEGYVAVK